MKPNIASEVLDDIAKKRGEGSKKSETKSRGARLLQAIKDEDAEAVDRLLCGDEDE
jgi:hypothetical protein